MSAKILVVDDEPDLQGLILQKFRRQIRDGSVSFLFARDGVEALTMLDGNRDVDMVLSDINMPRMDGLSLLGKLQESDENLSTVIVSAYGDMANIRTAMNRGAFDFVTKPIDFVDLETTIAKTIRHVGILREARRRQLAAERAHASLSRYFSPNLAERLASDAETIDLGGQRREIATLVRTGRIGLLLGGRGDMILRPKRPQVVMIAILRVWVHAAVSVPKHGGRRLTTPVAVELDFSCSAAGARV